MDDSVTATAVAGDSTNTKNSSKWLEALHDQFAGVSTITPNVCLADLFGDGDTKLLLADMGSGPNRGPAGTVGRDHASGWGKGMALRVYKGTSLMSEHTLVDLPLAIVPFYMSLPSGGTISGGAVGSSLASWTGGARRPAIAVASGSSLYVYRNMRPFYKYSLPAQQPAEAEVEAWAAAAQDGADLSVFRDLLVNVLAGGETLSAKSEHFLTTSTLEQATAFVRRHADAPLRRQTTLTAVATLKKSLHDHDALTCLVLATESRDVYVLEPDAFTVLATMSLPAVPAQLDVTGLFDVDYRIVVACRDGCVYALKRGQKAAKLCVELHTQAVGVCVRPALGCIVVGCMDRSLRCYSTQGKANSLGSAVVNHQSTNSTTNDGAAGGSSRHQAKYAQLWIVQLAHQVVAMQSVTICSLGLELVAVCCRDSNIYMYRERNVVDVISTADGSPVTAIRFGRFGREDNALVFVTQAGSLNVKILRRNQTFEPISSPPFNNVKPTLASLSRGTVQLPLQHQPISLASKSFTTTSTLSLIQSGATYTATRPVEASVTSELVTERGGFGTAMGSVGSGKFIIPKKTKLFVEQTMRERENAAQMHAAFSQDLQRMKLIAARHFAEVLCRAGAVGGSVVECGSVETALDEEKTRVSTQAHMTDSVLATSGAPLERAANSLTTPTSSYDVKLTARVQGLGPHFALIVTLMWCGPEYQAEPAASYNQSVLVAPQNLLVAFSYDSTIYRLDRPYRLVPYLPSGVATSVSVRVSCRSASTSGEARDVPLAVSDSIKVVVLRLADTKPLVTALINMPASQNV